MISIVLDIKLGNIAASIAITRVDSAETNTSVYRAIATFLTFCVKIFYILGAVILSTIRVFWNRYVSQ